MESEKKKKVYIACPYTLGDVGVNVRKAMDMADVLIKAGFLPFCPLWTHFQHIVHPMSYEQWMAFDITWMKECDCVLRLYGKSRGADREVKEAKKAGMPVFRQVKVLQEFYGINKTRRNK